MQRVTDRLVNWASILEDSTRQQAQTASEMPFIFPHIALMPDAHLGMGSTVGSVIPTRGAIMPAAVGVDIGCGMQAVRTHFRRKDFTDDLPYLADLIRHYIPMGIGPGGENNHVTDSVDARIEGLQASATKDYAQFCATWQQQLGSLGSGNHFIEVAYDEEDVVWLTLHSGSRGVGNKAAVHHIKEAEKACRTWFAPLPDKDLAYLPDGTEQFGAYMDELHWAQKYARFNRDEMMDRVLQAVAQWVGADVADVTECPIQERFDCHHNFTQRESHWGQNLWITRKGAIQARPGDVGLIPGSMGTPSYVVVGKGNKLAFDSAPHGAGRAMGRKQAFRTITMDEARAAMEGIVWGDHEKLIDESPAAYKDIARVIADAADLIEVKHTLRPMLNIKGL